MDEELPDKSQALLIAGAVSLVGSVTLGWLLPPLFAITGFFGALLTVLAKNDGADSRKLTSAFFLNSLAVVVSLGWSLWHTFLWFQTLGLWL